MKRLSSLGMVRSNATGQSAGRRVIRRAATARLREHVVDAGSLAVPLDDAVFSCGDLIAASGDAVVATACAGMPPSAETLTEWDAVCGQRPRRPRFGIVDA